MSVVRQGIQKKICQLQARQVLRLSRCTSREYHSTRIDPVLFSLPQQIFRGGRHAVLSQPQHAALYTGQNTHPARKHVGREFVAVVEAAKHKPLRGQTDLLARGAIGDHSCRVIRKIAVRQINDLLAVVGLMLYRNHRPITYQVIEVLRPSGSGIAQPGGLYRRHAPGEYSQAATLRVAVQIDGNIDPVLSGEQGDVAIVLDVIDIDKPVKGTLQPLSCGTRVIEAQRERCDLETVPVVTLK